MLDVVGEDLVVIANTGDDVEVYGAYVSPDPDLVTFWLADRIDERGWGLRDDTFAVMDGLRELGVDVWFNLGDRDLAIGLRRAERLAAGATLTEALAELGAALGVRARVLPMTDAPVRTRVLARGEWLDFQEFMIRERGEGPVDGVEYRGRRGGRRRPPRRSRRSPPRGRSSSARRTRSSRSARSSPCRGWPRRCGPRPRPSSACRPIVGGAIVKGPTEPFMAWLGHPLSATGIAAAYDGAARRPRRRRGASTGLPLLVTDTLMADAGARRRVADETLRVRGALAR